MKVILRGERFDLQSFALSSAKHQHFVANSFHTAHVPRDTYPLDHLMVSESTDQSIAYYVPFVVTEVCRSDILKRLCTSGIQDKTCLL